MPARSGVAFLGKGTTIAKKRALVRTGTGALSVTELAAWTTSVKRAPHTQALCGKIMKYDIQVRRLSEKGHGSCVMIDHSRENSVEESSSVTAQPHLAPWRILGLTQDQYKSSTGLDEQYRRRLKQQPDLLIPLMRMARAGPLVIVYDQIEAPPEYLDILRDVLIEQLGLEDFECASESSSPVCYSTDSDPRSS